MSTATLTPTTLADSQSFELPKSIKSATDINAVARILIGIKREATKIDEEEAVQNARKVIADAEARKQEISERFDSTLKTYGPKMEKFAFTEAGKAGRRSYETALTEFKWVACEENIDPFDKKKAIPYVQSKLPEAIELKPQIMKSKFTPEFKASIAELAEPWKYGFKVIPAHDNVHFKLTHEDILVEVQLNDAA